MVGSTPPRAAKFMKILPWVLVIVFKAGYGVDSAVIPLESETKCNLYAKVAEKGKSVIETFCFEVTSDE